jgi:hypothetical protein
MYLDRCKGATEVYLRDLAGRRSYLTNEVLGKVSNPYSRDKQSKKNDLKMGPIVHTETSFTNIRHETSRKSEDVTALNTDKTGVCYIWILHSLLL